MHEILQSLQLTLLNVGYAKLGRDWDYDNVLSPFSRLYYVTRGTAKVYHSYEEFDLRAGYLYLVPSFTYSRYRCDDYHEQFYIGFLEEVGNGLSVYNLRDFTYEVEATEKDAAYMKRLLEINPDRALKNVDPKVYDNRFTLANFKRKNNELSTGAYLETQALLQLLFSRFIQNTASNRISVRRDFNEVLSHIKEHLHEPLSIADLAAHYHLSSDHFSRVFQQKFGLRPSKYIQTIRIERSQTLLITTNHSIKEIAQKTGWNSTAYYARIFKKVTGVTPGEFRNERLSN